MWWYLPRGGLSLVHLFDVTTTANVGYKGCEVFMPSQRLQVLIRAVYSSSLVGFLVQDQQPAPILRWYTPVLEAP